MIEGSPLEHVDDPVIVVDGDRRVVDANASGAALAGTDPETVVGNPLGSVAGVLADVLEDEVPDRTTVEVEGRHYDVRASHVDDRESDDDGRRRTGEWVLVLRDVTDRERRERELERYERILNAVGDLVYALDDDGTILGVNDTAVEVSGYDREALVGSHISVLVEADDVERGRELVADLLEDDDRDQDTFEMDLIAADGERIRCENHVALVPDEDGEYRGTVGILRDVGEKRRRAQQLNVLNRVLRHDLRNDMNLVMGNAELLLNDPENAEEYVDAIRTHAQSVIARSNRIRRIERTLDQSPTDDGPVDLVELVEDCVETLASDHPEAAVETDLPDRAWASAPHFVRVAVDNALENAAVHNDDDPQISASVGVDGDQVVVTVADNGPGIPPAERRTLQRQRETPLEHASGIGLWTIHWVVDQCGGSVEFAENQPRGSVVRIRLPRATDPETDETAPSPDGDDDSPGREPRVRGIDLQSGPTDPGSGPDR